MSPPDVHAKPFLKPNWSNLAKLITTAVGGESLHLMGQVAHRVYYQMGVNVGAFPLPACVIQSVPKAVAASRP